MVCAAGDAFGSRHFLFHFFHFFRYISRYKSVSVTRPQCAAERIRNNGESNVHPIPLSIKPHRRTTRATTHPSQIDMERPLTRIHNPPQIPNPCRRFWCLRHALYLQKRKCITYKFVPYLWAFASTTPFFLQGAFTDIHPLHLPTLPTRLDHRRIHILQVVSTPAPKACQGRSINSNLYSIRAPCTMSS